MAVYFLSDLHLGSSSIADQHEAQRRLGRFFDSVCRDASSIYLVGDVLDYWYEYRYAVPRGYVRFFGKLAELADKGIKVTWLIGNHDIWIFDYLPQELGIRVVDGNLVEKVEGEDFFISHGDGIGKSTFTFRLIRSIYRNKVCQWLYSGIHPRWTIPFAHSWSSHSRKKGEEEAYKRKALTANASYIEFCSKYHTTHPDISHFVMGHTHLAMFTEIAPGCDLTVLGDCIDKIQYARYENGKITSHFYKE